MYARTSSLVCSLLLLCLVNALAKEDEVAAAERAASGVKNPTGGTTMLYGPVLSCSLEGPRPPEAAGPKPVPTSGRMLAPKAVVVSLGANACVAFDTELLRMAAVWTDGYLDLRDANIGSYKGERTGGAAISGQVQFLAPQFPGWVMDGALGDPRKTKGGPLPKSDYHYSGFYLNGTRAIFAYEAFGRRILDSFEVSGSKESPNFVRHFTVSPSTASQTLILAETVPGSAAWKVTRTSPGATGVAMPLQESADGRVQTIAVLSDSLALDFEPLDASGVVRVKVPPAVGVSHFDVLYLQTAAAQEAGRALNGWRGSANLAALCRGGDLRWPEDIVLKGAVSPDSAAYVVDTVPIPEQNPSKSWMRISGFDFFQDGRAAVCTLNGDVWLVSGIDTGLAEVKWKRFATGLYEPLGLKIVDGNIYVLGRDRITRLHDTASSGEADFYESFNADRVLYPSYHAFTFDLQTDSKGSFYYAVGGNQLGRDRPWHACVVKVSADGSQAEELGSGFRAPNGLEIGPNDEIAVSDNQGHWIPTSKISLVKPGGFYGHVADPRIDEHAPAPEAFDDPLLWLPYSWDNSSGGGAWAPDDGKWGPLSGHLLHTSYGKCALFAVMDDAVAGTRQGAAVRLPLTFSSGIMRARFNPADGQLYVGGLKGWQTSGVRDGCLQRVRYTGTPLYLPVAFHVAGPDSLSITFPVALDRETAADARNFSIEQWNYRWFSTYDSPEISVVDPSRKGRDAMDVASAALSRDNKTVTLTVPGLRKVMLMEIKGSLRAIDGTTVTLDLADTINSVPRK